MQKNVKRMCCMKRFVVGWTLDSHRIFLPSSFFRENHISWDEQIVHSRGHITRFDTKRRQLSSLAAKKAARQKKRVSKYVEHGLNFSTRKCIGMLGFSPTFSPFTWWCCFFIYRKRAELTHVLALKRQHFRRLEWSLSHFTWMRIWGGCSLLMATHNPREIFFPHT